VWWNFSNAGLSLISWARHAANIVTIAQGHVVCGDPAKSIGQDRTRSIDVSPSIQTVANL
jgi:hypothetical protein